MALENNGATNNFDAFVKMPEMITEIKGRGNGIKTSILNIVDISNFLARPAVYTTKYFGFELGVQSKLDEKTGICHLNGAHETAKLVGHLNDFIRKYVQCYKCGDPETEIIITRNKRINMKCASCEYLAELDMGEKLTSFILKIAEQEEKERKEKKAKRRAEKERLKEMKKEVTSEMALLTT